MEELLRFVLGLLHRGETVGKVVRNLLQLPPAPAKPGLYRFRLSTKRADALYIGESVNVARRFGQYQRPGPRQATNIRLNEALVQHLINGDQVAVDIALSMAGALGQQRYAFDLAVKEARRAAENAAILTARAQGIEVLNR